MAKKKELEYNFTHNGSTYVIGLGGIHSLDPPRLIRPKKDEILIDADIGLNVAQLKLLKLTGTSLEFCTLPKAVMTLVQ